jgi:hypothetical protein
MPAVTRTLRLGSTRTGRLMMSLPAAEGPYQLVGRVAWGKRGYSAEATATISRR